MIVSVLFNKITHFVLTFVALFRRALCCFRRRRRSFSDSETLTHVGVDLHREPLANWNWDENAEPRTVQDHIDLYRKKKLGVQQLAEQETDPIANSDFFEDMTPKITRQTKLFVNSEQNNGDVSCRLNLQDTVPMPMSELREWEDNSGWEGETLDLDTQRALKEKKRLDREKRIWEQQQKRMEKSRPLGEKIGT